jgi:cell division protein FtsI/penicillin-binding protein 2
MMPSTAANSATANALRWKRAQRLCLVFLLCSLALTARILWLAMQSKSARELIHNAAQGSHSLCIPGLRGRIIAHDGTVLAHSERRLRLFWQVPEELELAEASIARWEAVPERPFPLPARQGLTAQLGKSCLLADELPTEQAMLWQMAQEPKNGLSLRAYFVRYYIDDDDWRELLGAVQIDPTSGLEQGVHGLEKTYEQQLRGQVVTLSLLTRSQRAVIKENKLWQENQGKGRDLHLDHKLHTRVKR